MQAGAYFNWDIPKDRISIQKYQFPEDKPLWVLDELHKFRRWKDFLKGLYDEHHRNHHILVTGSARLDMFSKGGDSLQGRHFLHRLHPVTLSEYLNIPTIDYLSNFRELRIAMPTHTTEALNDLLHLGGFPEPLLSASKKFSARWRLSYGERLVFQDIRDTTSIKNLELLELFFTVFPRLQVEFFRRQNSQKTWK
jgi:predicted AAA+ superfamily ATPase